jgi:hypothetical protein
MAVDGGAARSISGECVRIEGCVTARREERRLCSSTGVGGGGSGWEGALGVGQVG